MIAHPITREPEQTTTALPQYDDLSQVPDHHRTRGNWLLNGRKLKSTARPVGLLRSGDSEFYLDRLFAFEDTRGPTPRERQLDTVWDVYCRHHHGPFIIWNDGKRGWTEVGKEYIPRGYAAHLRKRDLDDHLAHRRIAGVIGHGRATRFVAIDLDLHHKDNDPITPGRTDRFLAALKVLLAEFDGWHAQVKEQDAEGVHLIRVLDRPVPLGEAVAGVRVRLRRLDSLHPGLGLADLEVYPDPRNGFRLPLGRDRTVLTDRPLVPVPNRRGRLVGDLAAYAAWLGDPDRRYMPPEVVYHFVERRLRLPVKVSPLDPATVTKSTASPVSTKPSARDHVSFRGQTRRKIIDYWVGADTTKGQLNRMIAVTARLLTLEVGRDRAADVLEAYCDELPDQTVSSRLLTDRAEVSRDIRRTLARVYGADGGQADPAASAEVLARVKASWGERFLVSDKSTWGTPSRPSAVARTGAATAFDWTGEEVDIIRKTVFPILNVVVRDERSTKTRPPRDPAAELRVACDVVEDIVRTVHRYRDGEVAMTLIDTILASHGVRPGRSNAKRTRVMEVLEVLGWVVVRTKPWARRRATGYTVGEGLKYKFLQ